MIDAKVLFVLVVQLSSIISAFRSSNFDSSLFLFVNRSSNLSRIDREYFCGAFLLTRYHLLTTENCSKKVKKFNLSPITLAELRLDEDEIESEENEIRQISEIYLEKQNEVAIILLSNPQQTIPKRRSHPRKRQQNVFKVESPFQDYFDENFQTLILEYQFESVRTKIIDCQIQKNFSRIEDVNCSSLNPIDGWPLVISEKKNEFQNLKNSKKNRLKSIGRSVSKKSRK